jgi:hypothetical protein
MLHDGTVRELIEDRIEQGVRRWIGHRLAHQLAELVDAGQADFEFRVELDEDELPEDCPEAYHIIYEHIFVWRCVRGGATGNGMSVCYMAHGNREAE